MAMKQARKGSIQANGTTLYHEIRGEGPPILFVSGATGDAGHWARVVDGFSEDHTVVTYDRRGNSRSAGPDGWHPTSVEEQADDAAALLDGLGLGGASVFGTSSGGIITLGLLELHPGLLRAAVVHEPPLLCFFPDSDEPPPEHGSMEDFLRFVALGEEVYDGLDPETRTRMLGNGALFLEEEDERFCTFSPNIERLLGCGVPTEVATSIGCKGDPILGVLSEAAERLAGELNVPLRQMTGKHVPYLSHPDAFVTELRDLFDGLGA